MCVFESQCSFSKCAGTCSNFSQSLIFQPKENHANLLLKTCLSKLFFKDILNARHKTVINNTVVLYWFTQDELRPVSFKLKGSTITNCDYNQVFYTASGLLPTHLVGSQVFYTASGLLPTHLVGSKYSLQLASSGLHSGNKVLSVFDNSLQENKYFLTLSKVYCLS